MATTTTGERPPILLQEDNYLEWRRDIRAVLRGIGALGIVDGKETQPAADDSKLEKWLALSNKAASLILRSLSANQYVHVDEDDLPSTMWTKAGRVPIQTSFSSTPPLVL